MMIKRWSFGLTLRQSNMAWMRGALWPLGLMIPKWYHHRIVGCVLLKHPDQCMAGYVEDLCPKTEFSQVSRYLGISVP
jgi:hypothetical protein